ncbi:hypothetical protein JOQ06_016313 [Pogonophryne albipinna]|uniref:Uncharacterized protein n=1 Tax=Pogonophryne albipinna TaxID=1090488 RepID=A0AAD6APR5_9TELE|nr:hypothetical protein JOQ06_016313 [Pogonophryne albipinna]
MTHVLLKVREKLSQLNLPENEIQHIIDEVSQDDPMKLCNEGVLRDLKDIEDVGFQTDDGKTLKGSLLAISGDNLGSHCIGGFCENVSTIEELLLVVGVEDVEDLPLVKELDINHILTPIQCRKMLLAFRRKEDEQCPQQELPTPLPSTSTALTPPQPRATDSQSITLTLTSVDLALLHPNAWAENFCLPWEKLNAKLRLAVSK